MDRTHWAGRKLVAFVKSRLGLFRGDKVWLSASDDPDDHDLGLGDDDDAIAIAVACTRCFTCKYQMGVAVRRADARAPRTGSGCCAVPNVFDALTPKTIERLSGNQRGIGAAGAGPRGRRRDVHRQDRQAPALRQIRPADVSELDTQEISVTARHIFGVRAFSATAWQRDPHRDPVDGDGRWQSGLGDVHAGAGVSSRSPGIRAATSYLRGRRQPFPASKAASTRSIMLVRRTIGGVRPGAMSSSWRITSSPSDPRQPDR